MKNSTQNHKGKEHIFPHLTVDATTMFVVLDLDFNILQINTSARLSAERITGKSPKPGDPIMNFIHPIFQDQLQRDLNYLSQTGSVYRLLTWPEEMGGDSFEYELKFLSKDLPGIVLEAHVLPKETTKNNPAALKHSEIWDRLSVMLLTFDLEGRIASFNAEARKFAELQLNAKLVVGSGLAKAIPTLSEQQEITFRDALTLVLGHRQSYDFEGTTFLNGKLFHLKAELHPILNQGEVVGASALIEDDTEQFLRHKLKNCLHNFLATCYKAKTEEEVFVSLAKDILAEMYIDEAEILQLQGNELTPAGAVHKGSYFPHHFHRNCKVRLGEGITGRVAVSGKPIVVEDSSEDDRVIHWGKAFNSEIAVPILVKGNTYAVINCESQYVGFFKPIFLEILVEAAMEAGAQIERVLDRQEYRRMSDHFQAILDSTPNSFILLDKHLRILSYNKTAAHFMAAYAERPLREGESFLRFVNAPSLDLFRDSTERALAGELVNQHHSISKAKAQDIHLKLTFAPARNAQREIYGVTLIIEDITTERERESLMMQQNYELKKTNKELDEFVYSISHDVRAPLSSILGLSGLIEMANGLDEVKEYNQLLHESGEKLDHFIRNVLDYSRNKRKPIRLERIEAKTFIEEVLSARRYDEGYDQVEISLDISVKFILVDRFRLKIILENLISNAVKYRRESAEPSWIAIKLAESNGQLLVSVQDNGQGIEEQYQSTIFDMFVIANQRSKGNGIGMYIVKETVDLLKGSISLKSQVDVGTEFTVLIPTSTQHAHFIGG